MQVHAPAALSLRHLRHMLLADSEAMEQALQGSDKNIWPALIWIMDTLKVNEAVIGIEGRLVALEAERPELTLRAPGDCYLDLMLELASCRAVLEVARTCPLDAAPVERAPLELGLQSLLSLLVTVLAGNLPTLVVADCGTLSRRPME